MRNDGGVESQNLPRAVKQVAAANHAAYFTPILHLKALSSHNGAECVIDVFTLRAFLVPRTETTFVGRRR